MTRYGQKRPKINSTDTFGCEFVVGNHGNNHLGRSGASARYAGDGNVRAVFRISRTGNGDDGDAGMAEQAARSIDGNPSGIFFGTSVN